MKKLSFAILAVVGALVSAAPALADTVTYTLTTVDPTVAPGGTVTFDASIVASSTNTGDIYLDSGQVSSAQTGITVDGSDFNLTPAALGSAPLSMSYSGALFTVTALGTDAPGTYVGSFDVEVGDSANNLDISGCDSDSDCFISAPFEITVGSALSPTPEPASWLLLTTGLAAVVLLRRRFFTPDALPIAMQSR